MEKPASNLVSPCTATRIFTFLALALGLFFSISSQAQGLPLSDGKKYTIGDIKVTGTISFNEQTVIAYTGLKKGEEVFIPGDKISGVIKKLWDLDQFSDINFYITNVSDDNVADLEIEIQEVPKLNEVKVTGLKKREKEEIIKENKLRKGAKVSENLITTTKNYIESKYRKDGYFNTKVAIRTSEVKDTTASNLVNMVVDINQGDRVKIKDIDFIGNEKFSDAKLRRQMKNTKQKNFIRFWKRSKYVKADYKADKEAIIDKYKESGYRDARIVTDSLIDIDKKTISLKLNVEEGDQYYIGDINYLGNTVYSDEQLQSVLRINKGDVYNGVLLDKRIADQTKPDGEDLSNLYKNNGYLFSNINLVETNVYNDTIDFEIRIVEGKEAYFDHITVTGNDKTKDHVIYRELRTKPGQKYSQEDVVSTVRELGQLGFFDAEQLEPKFVNPDPQAGTLDLEYSVVESGASQIELQGGYGGGGFIGTLGLSFNNFSLSGIFDKDAYKPVPMGDGQTLSLRAQASTFYQTYSLSFMEPWLGGKKPVSLQTSFSYTRQFLFDYRSRKADRSRSFDILGVNVGLAKRLTVPDPYITVSHSLGFQRYNLNNYNTGLFTFGDGHSNNFTYTLGLTRDNTYVNPIFPMGGSKFKITAKFTPPYSLWNGIDYANLADQREFQLEDENGNLINTQGDRVTPENAVGDQRKIDQKKFNWLEFYKVKFSGDWYTNLFKKLVLKTSVEYGFLGAYNNDRGIPPFERFFLGGDGLGAFSLDGRETIQLRGYPNQSVVPMDRPSGVSDDGATIYNKYSLELRYPITLKPSASIYALTFIEGGASYDNFKDFNPFQLSRSAGAGLRIFMPAFGLLGIDFGYGFDPIGTDSGAHGWETHFIIGQQF
ncbi:Beta-barrel assembly machine subunit BamA [Salegentibacter echinorum]|uniref:Outer membrane protein assembly factor BamA n=1 Tax=Salegentibacter echinorum TaxID=1073325 RepID=A0A1M5H8E0_SALEC|nr:outer membrane protein assembly factor BamA [Salegentibacter echinorum]SHG12257.1 Beta-barrel assembly machine subunit BamA [Salegentibacter echinorum]